jgi:hypothetical protein
MHPKIHEFMETLKEKPIDEGIFKKLVAHYNDLESIVIDERNEKRKNHVYVEQLTKCIKIIDITTENIEMYYNMVKTTRASCTTNTIISAMIRNKRILVVEPTNEIARSTVKTALSLYQDSTGDYSKIVRQIPSNQLGCSKAKAKVESNKALKELPFILSENCKECEIPAYDTFFLPILPFSTCENCYIKTMMEEKNKSMTSGKVYAPDILTITYDKLLSIKRGDKLGEKAAFYTDLISKMDIIFFDEIGQYLSDFQGGLDIYTKEINRVNKTEKVTTNVMKQQLEFLRYLNNLKENGYNYKKIDSIVKMVTTFFGDFTLNCCKKYIDMDLSGEIDLRDPRYVKNILSTIPTATYVKKGKFNKKIITSKLEAIRNEFSQYYIEMEDVIIGKSVKNSAKVEWALKVLQLIQDDEFVVYKRRFPDMEHDEIEYEVTTIYPTTENILKAIESWTEGKTVLFTDATMPAYYLQNFKKHCHSIHFGDPLKTNSQMLIINDKNKGMYDFGIRRWNNNIAYKNQIIDRICDLIYYFNFYREIDDDEDSGILIWTPSKKICEELEYRLSLKEINGEKINFCSMDDYMQFVNDEKHKYHLVRGKVLVTYYGSPLTRGIKCNRRVQILLGKASKPIDSYKHVAYMQRSDWKTFSDKEIKRFAEKEGMAEDEYRALLEKFKKGIRLSDRTIKIKDVPKELKAILKEMGDTIQHERTYMDTWQAGSRAKDSEGKVRSTLICIGWKHKEIWELVRWGDSETVKYLPVFSDRGSVTRYAVKQEHLIAPPNVLKLIGEYQPIMDWLYGKSVDIKNIGFDIDLYFGIMDMLCRTDEVTSEEVWLELTKNMNIGHYDEDYKNGYMVGSVNAFLVYGMDGIETIKDSASRFIFRRSDCDNNVKRNIEQMQKNYDVLGNTIRFLRDTFKHKKNVVNVSEIVNFNKFDDKEKNEVMEFIIENKILEGSSWKLEGEKITKRVKPHSAEECRKDVKNKKTQLLLTSKLNRIVLDVILGWYNHSNEYILKLKDVKNEVNKTVVVDNKDLREILKKLFPDNESFKQYHLNGCKMLENGVTMMIIKP